MAPDRGERVDWLQHPKKDALAHLAYTVLDADRKLPKDRRYATDISNAFKKVGETGSTYSFDGLLQSCKAIGQDPKFWEAVGRATSSEEADSRRQWFTRDLAMCES